MDEGHTHLTKKMEALLSKFDEQKAAHDKQIEMHAAFNTKVTQELEGLAKQLDLTQADVDPARKTVEGVSTSASSVITVVPPPQQPPPTAPHQSSPPQPPSPRTPGAAHPRLGDARPPLIPVPPAGGSMVAATTTTSPTVFHSNGRYQKPPKHDFPRFDGTAPYLWLDRCLAYFELYKVAPHNWVATAALYIDGQAAHWLQAFRQTHRGLTWELFSAVVLDKFSSDEFELVMHKLLQLRQTGTVAEYRAAFDEQMYHLLALDPSINTKFFVTQFLLGLKDELRASVCLQAPSSITRASVLARIQEEELDRVMLLCGRECCVGGAFILQNARCNLPTSIVK